MKDLFKIAGMVMSAIKKQDLNLKFQHRDNVYWVGFEVKKSKTKK